MFYMGFFAHLESVVQPGHGLIDNKALTSIIGILFALTVLGFIASSIAAGQQPRRHGG